MSRIHLAALCLVASTILFVLSRVERSAPAQTTRTAQVPAATLQTRIVQAQVESLRAEVHALRDERAATAGPDAEEPHAQAAETETTAAVNAKDRERQVVEDLTQTLAEEGRDPVWSDQTERAIEKAVASSAMIGTSLIAADCRTSLCRGEFVHQSELARDQFFEELPTTAPFDTKGFVILDEESGTTIVHFSRPGREASFHN